MLCFVFAVKDTRVTRQVPARRGRAGSPVPGVVFQGLSSSPASPSALASHAALLFTAALGVRCAARFPKPT